MKFQYGDLAHVNHEIYKYAFIIGPCPFYENNYKTKLYNKNFNLSYGGINHTVMATDLLKIELKPLVRLVFLYGAEVSDVLKSLDLTTTVHGDAA